MIDFDWKKFYRNMTNEQLLDEIAKMMKYQQKLILDLPGSKTQVGNFLDLIISSQFRITQIVEVLAERSEK